MAQALYRRWRPQTWDAVVGQDHVVQTLRNAVKGDRVAHAYLFAGPRGTGKTTTARLLAKAVNCLDEDLAERPCNRCAHCRAVVEGSFLDLIEIDAASNTSVEDVRDLRDKINFAPNEGRFKVYIIDEVHMLSTAAFNALLKTLEEPPEHAIFVLATTEVHKIPATVLSRCQRHEFRRLPVATILDYLEARVAEEGFDVEGRALELIARQATGSLRDAISLLDQLTSTGGQVDLERTQAVLGTANAEAVVGVVQALADRDAAAGLTLLNQAVDGGADPRQLARQVVDHLRALLLIRSGNEGLVEALDEERERMRDQARAVPLDRLMRAIDAFHRAALEGRSNWQPKLPLELALVETLHAGQEADSLETAGDRGGNSTAGDEPADDETAGSIDPVQARAAGGPKPAAGARAQESEDPSAEGRPAQSRDGELTFQSVLDRWDELLSAARRHDPKVQGLLNSSRPLGLDQGALVLGFASDLLCEKMERDDNLETLRKALNEALGQPLGVRCVLTSKWQQEQASPDAPPLDDDGMVATALRDLGAEVAEVRPASEEGEESERG